MESQQVTPQAMRSVLGAFCSGVVIVTATSQDALLGFTCQSFASLSLDPPLVSFSPARTSTTWPRIRELGRFCVNVLAHDQHELSARFADREVDRFADVEWRSSPLGSPILAGVSAWIDCELIAEHDGGDHTIVIGAVRGLDADAERYPLLFYRGRYAPWTAVTP